MSAAEIAAAKAEIRRLTLPLDLRRTRRRRPDPNGPAHRPARHHPRQPAPGRRDPDDRAQPPRRTRPPPLVVLCDISGSMARYAQILLHFLHAVANDRDRVHVFLFGTRLSNITRQLRHRDPEVAFQMVAHAVPGLVRRHPHRRGAGHVQPVLGAPRARPGRGGAAGHRRAGPRRARRGWRRTWTGCTAPAAADLAEPAVAVGAGSSQNHRASARCCRTWTSSARCIIWPACARWSNAVPPDAARRADGRMEDGRHECNPPKPRTFWARPRSGARPARTSRSPP